MGRLNDRQIERYECESESYERFDNKKRRNNSKPRQKEKHKWKRDSNQ